MFDAHVHIIDPRFPLIENEGFIPAAFTIADYRERMRAFEVQGGAVVSASFQGYDTEFLRTAIAELGPGWVGVVNLPHDTTDEDIAELDRAGVRALRFNLKRAAGDIAELTMQAVRAYEVAGWHVELYIDGSMLASLEPVITKLPALTVDHLGMSDDCLPYLLDLVDRGARVKASGFGRVSMNIPATLRRIHAINPEALMFGSDLPGTRAGRPFRDEDVRLIADALGTDLYRVFEDNARACYRLPARDRGADPAPTQPLPQIERKDPPTLRLNTADLQLDTDELPATPWKPRSIHKWHR
ncbi:amidohydrolase family protein [Nocardia stercoris]|uniref:amidohydrolase family protein n=1 Tax=Nocardia stercoris TaxID=2483361 RepID=UPI001F31795D|nr:amidohydrolase family protein [Nocardia stercoris]